LIPGRSQAPHVPIPTYRYGTAGKAVRAAAPTEGANITTQGDAAVNVTDSGFSDARLSIPAGSSITWAFNGSVLHNVTLASGPEGFSSDRLASGRTFFNGSGVLSQLVSSPDGRWLLLAWPTANQWVFVRLQPRKIVGVSRVTQQFGRSATIQGWCCAG